MTNTQYSGWYFFNKIEKVAEQLRKADPSLSYEQSIEKATEERPDLREAYTREFKKDLLGEF